MMFALQIRPDNIEALVVFCAMLGKDLRYYQHQFPYLTEVQYFVLDFREGPTKPYAEIRDEPEFVNIYKYICPPRPHTFTEVVYR